VNDMNQSILIIIPVYNEENNIGTVLKRLRLAGFSNVLVVNDGSTDKTLSILEQNKALTLNLKRHMGVGQALKSGLRYALIKDYKIVVIMAGDDQDDPREIKELINPIIQDKFDFVQGSRYIQGKHVTYPIKQIQTTLYSLLFSIVANRKVTDASNGFRAIKLERTKKDILPILQMKDYSKYEFEPYLMLKVIRFGFRFTEVPVKKYYNKQKGYTKMIPVFSWYEIIRPLFHILIKTILGFKNV
jgi:dolichol-phosphate mannosyltransferase